MTSASKSRSSICSCFCLCLQPSWLFPHKTYRQAKTAQPVPLIIWTLSTTTTTTSTSETNPGFGSTPQPSAITSNVDCSWNVMSHGDAREGMWRGNWQMQWVASILHTTSEHAVSSITTAYAHTLAASNRLNWRPPADLYGLVRFAERRNLISALVPSHFKRSLRRMSLQPLLIPFTCQPFSPLTYLPSTIPAFQTHRFLCGL